MVSGQAPGQGCEYGMRFKVIEPATARLIIMIKPVLKADGFARPDLTVQAHLQRMLLVRDSQRQAGRQIILAKVRLRK